VNTTGPRTAIITGASRGIGAALSTHLAGRGWSLGICARDPDRLDVFAETLRAKYAVAVHAAPVDVSDPTAVRRFADNADEALGPASLIVNNAAVFGPVGRITDIDLGDWHRALTIGACGTANVTAAFWEQLTSTSDGRIINLSGGGLGGPNPVLGSSSYAATKAAIALFTEVLAPEATEIGATVNAVAPGALPTGFMDEAVDAGPGAAGATLYEAAAGLRGGEGPVELPVGLLRLLDHLLKPSSAWINGCILSAKWDTPERLDEHRAAIESGSFGRLRRIDADLFHEGPR
jgi:NAD(P)-dependent dehydrogenase (short-subunit alcohol dehydrogenase family)